MATTETTKVLEIDCSTGIETIRDMTTEEIEAQETMKAEFETLQAKATAEAAAISAAKESANAKLAALGLTAEEIAALSN